MLMGGINVSLSVGSGTLYVGKEGMVVFMGEDGLDDDEGVSISESLERGTSSQMLMIEGMSDEEELEYGCFSRSLSNFFFILLSVFLIFVSCGNRLLVRKDLGIDD